ncbi:MAG: hypothetical protein K0R63_1322 [Rickettsiales bacterium]|jgi:hypothetical protein|nr:hypothetical protein [Rickettsiales bacterium]
MLFTSFFPRTPKAKERTMKDSTLIINKAADCSYMALEAFIVRFNRYSECWATCFLETESCYEETLNTPAIIGKNFSNTLNLLNQKIIPLRTGHWDYSTWVANGKKSKEVLFADLCNYLCEKYRKIDVQFDSLMPPKGEVITDIPSYYGRTDSYTSRQVQHSYKALKNTFRIIGQAFEELVRNGELKGAPYTTLLASLKETGIVETSMPCIAKL